MAFITAKYILRRSAFVVLGVSVEVHYLHHHFAFGHLVNRLITVLLLLSHAFLPLLIVDYPRGLTGPCRRLSLVALRLLA